jgi:hypothetical protein
VRVWYSTVVKYTFLSLCYLSPLMYVKSAISASCCATSDKTIHRSQTGNTHLSALFLFPPLSLPPSLPLFPPHSPSLFLLFLLLILPLSTSLPPHLFRLHSPSLSPLSLPHSSPHSSSHSPSLTPPHSPTLSPHSPSYSPPIPPPHSPPLSAHLTSRSNTVSWTYLH